jgi:serine/threonine protein kinase
MGQVYLAEHQRIARRVAVKVLLPEFSANQSVVERFLSEARATSLIRHPGIVEVLDCDVVDNQAYIVMEFLEGESLGGYLARVGGLRRDVGFALAVVGQVANAVGTAHASDIVHRDLKPDNIFLCASARNARVVPKVLDFGIAKLAVQGSSGQTKTGMLMGTPAYMSPEQCRGGSKAVDGRSDVYSLGCILYEMLCGQPPFVRDGAGELIVAHVAEPPDDPRKAVPELPSSISALVLRMLGKNAQDRPSEMAVVSSEITRCLEELGISLSFGDISPREPVKVPQIPSGVGPSSTPAPGAAVGSPFPVALSAVPTPPRVATRVLPGSTQLVAEGDDQRIPDLTTLGGAIGQSATMSQREPPHRPAVRWALAGALAAGGALVIAFGASRSHSAPPAAEPSLTPEPAATVMAPPAPARLPALTSVTIDVRGLPVGGELLLEGARTIPPLKLRRDGRRYLLIARAPGFYDRTIEIEADHDQAVDLALTAMDKPAKMLRHESSSGRHHASAPHGSAAATEATAPTKPPQGAKKTTTYDEM